MSTAKKLITVLPALLLMIGISVGPAAVAQEAREQETEQQFLSRTQSRFARAERRIDDLERVIRGKMGNTTHTNDGFGFDSGNNPGMTSNDPMSTDLRSMRLELRSLRKRVEKDSEKMADQYRERGTEGFDRDYWDGYVRRLEHKLYEMERDVRRL